MSYKANGSCQYHLTLALMQSFFQILDDESLDPKLLKRSHAFGEYLNKHFHMNLVGSLEEMGDDAPVVVTL